jgi:hypothetical protein
MQRWRVLVVPSFLLLGLYLWSRLLVPFGWVSLIALAPAAWVAYDSRRIRIQDYNTSLSYGPALLFLFTASFFVVVLPWYLTVRDMIRSGRVPLRETAAPSSPNVGRRWRWRRWFLLTAAGAAVYTSFFYPRGTFHDVGHGQYLEVFGAQRLFKWESQHGRAQLLQLSFASLMNGFRDTAAMWRESRLLLPLAESTAARTGDTIIELEHIRYPLSRMLPVRITAWTYYHRGRDDSWAPSTTLWH